MLQPNQLLEQLAQLVFSPGRQSAAILNYSVIIWCFRASNSRATSPVRTRQASLLLPAPIPFPALPTFPSPSLTPSAPSVVSSLAYPSTQPLAPFHLHHSRLSHSFQCKESRSFSHSTRFLCRFLQSLWQWNDDEVFYFNRHSDYDIIRDVFWRNQTQKHKISRGRFEEFSETLGHRRVLLWSCDNWNVEVSTK